MSLRYPGAVLSATPPVPTASAASGIWTTEQQFQAEAAGNWPSPIYFGDEMRSLRFNSADSAYLNRTPGSAGNRKTWTFSCWVKRSGLGANQALLEASDGSYYTTIYFDSNDRLSLYRDFGSSQYINTSAVYRDTSAWYHVVVAADTTQSTSTNRVKMYVNGAEITSFNSSTYPNLDDLYQINNTVYHSIGARYYSPSFFLNGYMTEVNFIDGQALTPSSFGQTNSTTGVWEPIAYAGSYGSNGFYLKFQDNSGTTATTLGKDSSGNGNNWTPNNFSVTAGIGNDSFVDVPFLSVGTGGQARGNYATLNPLVIGSGGLANGNLQQTGVYQSNSTIGFSSGKWYWEYNVISASIYYGPGWGFINASQSVYVFLRANEINVDYAGVSITKSGSGNITSGIVSVAFDMDAGTAYMYADNVLRLTVTGIPNGTYFPVLYGDSASDQCYINFGQRPFAYTAPSGFKELCTQNLPTPAVIQGDDHFNTVLWTGDGSTKSITGVGFQPELVWIKERSNASAHAIFDVLRSGYVLSSNTAGDEVSTDGLVSYDSDGFTVKYPNTNDYYINRNGQTYVAWNWNGGGTGVTNTQGTITSTVSANTTAGFSIVTWTGTGSNGTVGHGLGAVPKFWINKSRNTSTDWYVDTTVIDGSVDYLVLNSTAAAANTGGDFSIAPTSSVISLGNASGFNGSGNLMISYVFAPVAGFSEFGRYTGNGSTDGPFVYTGFRPAYVLIKSTAGSRGWGIFDTKRRTFNVNSLLLEANTNGSEIDSSSYQLDFLSNGFKIRTSNQYLNYSGDSYIYAAFAENPFKYALAR